MPGELISISYLTLRTAFTTSVPSQSSFRHSLAIPQFPLQVTSIPHTPLLPPKQRARATAALARQAMAQVDSHKDSAQLSCTLRSGPRTSNTRKELDTSNRSLIVDLEAPPSPKPVYGGQGSCVDSAAPVSNFDFDFDIGYRIQF
jgi:hypothetical protein